jgi:protein-disulfide isomerase
MTTTRRRFLAGAGAAGVAALAGCSGMLGSSGGSGANRVESMPQPTAGPEDAPVTIQVWEDFACPHCQTFSLRVLPDVMSQFVDAGDARYVHHDFPIPVDQRWSWDVAFAARHVQREAGPGAFFEFTHAAYENQGAFSMDLLASLAAEHGVEGVRAAVNDERYRPVVEADRQRGSDAGLRGTPFVLVNGEAVNPSFDAIRRAVQASL